MPIKTTEQVKKRNTAMDRIVAEMRRYADNEQWLFDSLPNKRIFIVYDAERLCMRVVTRKSSDLEQIVNEFREIDTGAFFAQRWSRNTIESYHYSVSPFGYFQPGLVGEVIKCIRDNKMINPFGDPVGSYLHIAPGAMAFMLEWVYPLGAKVKELLAKGELDISNISEDRTEDDSKVMRMRDYQEEAIYKILTAGQGRGLVEAATGAGKSFIIANLLYTLRKLSLPRKNARALIYVPNIQLVEQFYSDLLSYGYREDELCKCSGSLTAAEARHAKENAKKAWIVIANSAWCNNHIDEIGEVDVLVIDEAHRCTAGSKGFLNIKEHLFKCKVRVGFTGTLPQKYNFWELEGLIGPVVYKASITDLQDAGYLTNLKITKMFIEDSVAENDTDLLFNVNSKWKLDDYNFDEGTFVGATDAWIAEQNWCSDNAERIYAPVINYICNGCDSERLNTLLLFDRLALGHEIEHQFNLCIDGSGKTGALRALYLDGSTPVAEREKVRATLEQSNGNILVGQSTILSTGINIKNLSRVVLLSAGKAQSRIIQAIGRTLRLNAGKLFSELIDVELNYRYSERHAAERKRLYKEWYGKKKFDERLEFKV